jgi:hypothetical protein
MLARGKARDRRARDPEDGYIGPSRGRRAVLAADAVARGENVDRSLTELVVLCRQAGVDPEVLLDEARARVG